MSSGSHFWNLEPTGLLYCLRLNQSPIASDLIYCVYMMMGFPSDASGKDLAASAGDMSGTGSIPGSGRSPEGGNGNPLQHSCWRILQTEKPNGLQSRGLQKVRHD